MTTLYLAYGSNLNKRAMRMRCPTARPRGCVYLTKARLTFRSVADVELVDDERSVVPCGLWLLNQADEAALDRYEGVAGGMYRRVWVPTKQGKALLYLMSQDRWGKYPPSQAYLDTIVEGYRDFGFEKKYFKALEAAVDRSFDHEMTEQIETRLERQRRDPKHQLAAMPRKTKTRKLRSIAEAAIEKYIGDVAPDVAELPEEDKSAALTEEAYCLALDALINKGIGDEEAAKIARAAAASFEF